MAAVALRTWDTGSVTLERRLSSWSELTARLLVPLEIRSRNDTVDGSIREVSRGVVSVSRFTASPHFGIRTRASLAAHPGAGLVKVALALRGGVTVEQGGRRTVLSPGEIAVYSAAAPYAVGSDTAYDLTVAILPADLLSVTDTFLHDVAALPIDPRTARPVRTKMMEACSLSDARADLFGDTLRAALRRALHTRAPQRSDTWLYREVVDLIHRRARTAELTPAYLAAALGVSRRSLYSAFASQGAGVAELIRTVKLNLARDLLRQHPAEPVGEIASEVGFDDPAHFTRSYRREFGRTPTAEREAVGLPIRASA